MEINNRFSHLARKDLPQGSPLIGHRELGMMQGATEAEIQSQCFLLKQRHQLEQQMLYQQFQDERLRLAAEQEKQMADQVKAAMIQKQQEYLEQQKKLEEQQRLEKERQELERLRQIKNKKKEEESAVASSEVKAKLQAFVLNKKQQEAHANHSPPQFRHWSSTHHSSLDQHSPPTSGMSPPYRPHPLLGQYDSDFPLRKTVSDSNLGNLKVRSKIREKVVQRSSPLLRRKDPQTKRKTPLSIDVMSHSNPDSGPNTPPNNSAQATPDASGPQSKEDSPCGPFPLQLLSKMVTTHNHSLPNISIGLPRNDTANSPELHNMSPGEAELCARAAAQYGMPLTPHMLHGSLPFHPSLPVIDSEFTPPTSPAYIAAQMKNLEHARSTGKLVMNPTGQMVGAMYGMPNRAMPMTGQQAVHARLQSRMLNRTHSAPLPLSPPLLNQQLLLAQQNEQLLKESQKLYLKQRLQTTVLQRAGSKNHMENVDEEAEARLAQEMKEVREREEDDVVVLSDKEEQMSTSTSPPESSISQERAAFLAQQREMMEMRQRTLLGGSPPIAATCIPHQRPPLERAQSSPTVTMSRSPPAQDITMKGTFTTGLAYDDLMLKHVCICGNNTNHPEHAGRLHSIWARLRERGLVKRCERVPSRKATIEELQTCHEEAYTLLYGTNYHSRQKLDPKILESLPSRFCRLPCGGVGVDSDTMWNDRHTSDAARMATGCAIELAFKVALGEIKNGMAVVRPPGHHAEPGQAMGFCFFNSVAVTARLLHQRLKLDRILIIDWDVHHGNSTQQIFYNDPHVLYISIHRHDQGNFFPGTGAMDECGGEGAVGFNVNIPFAGSLNMADAEYLAAFRTLIMPIAREFQPDIVLVSAGFDAANGHPAPLGGYRVSSECFGHLTKQIMTLANGKVVLVLEGGYDLPSICDASEVSVQALLGDEIPPKKKKVPTATLR